MPMSIDYYINAVVEKSDNYLNLTSLDFSAETPEMIARFCLWLQNHLYITEILWMDYQRTVVKILANKNYIFIKVISHRYIRE